MNVAKRAIVGQLPCNICEQRAVRLCKLTQRIEGLQVAHVFGIAALCGAIGNRIPKPRKPVYEGWPFPGHRLKQANHRAGVK